MAGSEYAKNITREELDAGNTTWLTTPDFGGLGLTDCGCGKEVEKRIIQTRQPALEVIFYHDGESSRCMMAFLRPDFTPLTYQAYCDLFPKAIEDEGE